MLKALYTPNTPVIYLGLEATATALPNKGLCLTFSAPGKDPAFLTEDQVYECYDSTLFMRSNKKPEPKLQGLTQKDHSELNRRNAYINELKRVSTNGGCGGVALRSAVIAHISRKIGDTQKPSPATLARWYKKATESSLGGASTLPLKARTRRSNFSAEIRDIALGSIDKYYLRPGKPSVQYAYDCFIPDLIEALGNDTPRPCYGTFNMWINEMVSYQEIIKAREGTRALRAAERKQERQLVVHRIHERAEADAVHLAVGIIDDQANYLGTVTLYAVIDCYSRAITGINVQVGRGESAASVIECYRHAISPKPRDSYSIEAINDWPMYGSPEKFVVDGGTGYVANNTMSFCMQVESQVEIVPTGKGWKKPYIERFFNTLRVQFASSLPGYCGKYTNQQKIDKNVQEQASLTLDQFESLLTHWIIDEYHQSQHSGLSAKTPTPYATWKKGAMDFPPLLPANFEAIRYVKGETFQRTIQGDHGNQGVVINNIHYNDSEGHLKEIYYRLTSMNKKPVITCDYSSNDISSISIVNPLTDEIHTAYCVDQKVTEGMSLIEYQAKYPPQRKDKGFGHPRVAAKSKVLDDVKKQHAQKTKPKAKRSKPAKIDEMTKTMHEGRDNSNLPPDVTNNSNKNDVDTSPHEGAKYDSNHEFNYS
ncbi:hypothetical protein [Amphritea sp.]|uniref:hypothetical protein n=1 Tax=Amphritea sp. TaxID=1872502 RepID=UPI003A951612